jgi:DNA repair protein RadC
MEEENTMSRTVEAMSDVDLLGTLVGARTAAQMLRVTSGSLATLLNESVATAALPTNGVAQVLAARELVRRALEESVRQGDVLSSPARVREFLRLMLAGRDHEVFMVLFLNSQNQVIAPEVMFRGTLTQTSVYPREVVRRSLMMNAAAVIFAHNHPSGVAEPSQADQCLTESLKRALALVDIRVLDHFVVAGTGVTSFAERGLL